MIELKGVKMKVFGYLFIIVFSSFSYSKTGPVSDFQSRCQTLLKDDYGLLKKHRISSIEVYSVRISDYEYSRSLQLDFIGQDDSLDNKLYIPAMNNGESENLLISLASRASEQNSVVSVCYNKNTNIIEALKIE